jgi:hypothetical protein
MAIKTCLLWVRRAPVFVGCGHGVIVTSQVAANQMPYPGAAVLVFKDLADSKDFFCIPFEQASHGRLFWEIERIISFFVFSLFRFSFFVAMSLC